MSDVLSDNDLDLIERGGPHTLFLSGSSGIQTALIASHRILQQQLADAKAELSKTIRKHDELASILIAAKVKTQAIEREIINPRIKDANAAIVELADIVKRLVECLYHEIYDTNDLTDARIVARLAKDSDYQRAVELKRKAQEKAHE